MTSSSSDSDGDRYGLLGEEDEGRYRAGSEISQPDGGDYRQERKWSHTSSGGGNEKKYNLDKLAIVEERDKNLFYTN